MRRDRIEFGFLLIVAIFAFGVFALVRPARSESHLYPVLEYSLRAESGAPLRQWAQLSCPVSLGRFALVPKVGASTKFDTSAEISVKYLLRRPPRCDCE